MTVRSTTITTNDMNGEDQPDQPNRNHPNHPLAPLLPPQPQERHTIQTMHHQLTSHHHPKSRSPKSPSNLHSTQYHFNQFHGSYARPSNSAFSRVPRFKEIREPTAALPIFVTFSGTTVPSPNPFPLPHTTKRKPNHMTPFKPSEQVLSRSSTTTKTSCTLWHYTRHCQLEP
jgi:hypothetical protein